MIRFFVIKSVKWNKYLDYYQGTFFLTKEIHERNTKHDMHGEAIEFLEQNKESIESDLGTLDFKIEEIITINGK